MVNFSVLQSCCEGVTLSDIDSKIYSDGNVENKLEEYKTTCEEIN